MLGLASTEPDGFRAVRSDVQCTWHTDNLKALILVISHWWEHLWNTQLAVSTDIMVVWCLCNQGTTYHCSLLQKTFQFFVDALSKLDKSGSFIPRPSISYVSFSDSHIDLFAISQNFQIWTYVSLVSDPQAWAVDALSFPWEGLRAYAPAWDLIVVLRVLLGPPFKPLHGCTVLAF